MRALYNVLFLFERNCISLDADNADMSVGQFKNAYCKGRMSISNLVQNIEPLKHVSILLFNGLDCLDKATY